jgi:hypothetical protein
MSQAGIINTSTGPVPPTVATSYVTDSGTAVPALNVLNVLTAESSINIDRGVETTGSGNTVTVLLTNRITGTVTTNNATPTTIISFPLGATPGVYFFDGDIVAFDSTDTAGAAYSFTSGMRTTGAAAIEIGTEFKDLFEEVAMSASDFNVIASGNSIVIQAVGIAAKTIDWNCYLNYRFVS